MFTSLCQAMQEPGVNSHYLSDMRLWVTHVQFIVKHIDPMTTLARDHYMLTDTSAADYLASARWRYKAVSNGWNMTVRAPKIRVFSTPMAHRFRRLRS